ncbi:MAG TPA: hypothetical protein VM165_23265 [Planctomycetaceae bacterium]|nr:hypothetical protein [Planctomycetaceae bacterium]
MPRSIGWCLVLWAGLCLLPGAGAFGQPGDAPALLPAAPEPSPLLTEPKTPEQTFDAVVTLIDLGRFDLAKTYLEQFVQADPSDEVLLAMRDRHGTGTFLKLARIRDLQATAQPLLQRLNALSRAQAEDPGYVDGLIAKLFGSPTERELATQELRNAGSRAVPQLLRKIAAAGSTNERDILILVLSRMGQPVAPVLIAALDAPSEAIRLASIQTLHRLEYRAAVPSLWPVAYATDVEAGTQLAAKQAIAQIRYGNADRLERLSTLVAVDDLTKRARQLLTGQDTLAVDGMDTVEVWSWNNADNTVVAEMLPVEAANLRMAARHARDALSLSPERSEYQRLYLMTLLAGEVQGAGWATLDPAQNAVLSSSMAMGVDPLLAALREAMTLGRTDAAWGAIQALSSIASPDVLHSRSGKTSPLISALNYPDPRVQFGAAMAILRSEPTRSFPNASRVVDVLRRALTDPGQARAVVIDADVDRATTVSGYLAEEGFDALVATTGKAGFARAAELAGVDLIVVHANCMQWNLTQTLANLRADARTEFIPIVIYGPEETRDALDRLVMRTPRSVFAAESPGSSSFWVQVTPFLKRHPTPPVSAEQRGAFRSLAAYWLATVAQSSQGKLFKFTEAAPELLPLIDDEQLANDVLVALGSVPSADVQTKLAEAVLNDRLPMPVRIRAAEQLTTHIPRFGLLMEQGTVNRLTMTWEATDNAALKAALSGLVGMLKPNDGLVGERLLRLSLAPKSKTP